MYRKVVIECSWDDTDKAKADAGWVFDEPDFAHVSTTFYGELERLFAHHSSGAISIVVGLSDS